MDEPGLRASSMYAVFSDTGTCILSDVATKHHIRTGMYSPTPLLAVGTTSGNIDMFDVSGPRISKEPVKAIPNLVASVNNMRFHPSGELLVAASQEMKDALKVIHMGTGTVYKNWPT